MNNDVPVIIENKTKCNIRHDEMCYSTYASKLRLKN